jgi:hypothetical protein
MVPDATTEQRSEEHMQAPTQSFYAEQVPALGPWAQQIESNPADHKGFIENKLVVTKTKLLICTTKI